MSVRSILMLLFGGVVAAALVVIIGSLAFVKQQITVLFPASVALASDDALRMLLIEQAVGLVIASVVLLGAMFYVLGKTVLTPLKKLTTALEQYETTGERIPPEEFEESPKEFQDLIASFDEFTERIEAAHRNDLETSRIKSDFISTAAHQLRTPLTGIRWALEALQKGTMNDDQRVLVNSAVDKSRDLVAIVGTLLDISAIESGKYKYNFQATDMHALLVEVANDFSYLASNSKVSLFYAQEEAPLPRARVDRDRIKWVLNNLVENAIRYTPPDGTVRLSAEAGRERVTIRVRDTGIGIPDKDRANIFERFYRAENATAMQNAGNGLGLYIARTIAKDHGGDLNFAPNEGGRGTTFILSVPVAR
ncbi:MAG: two-component system, OmpR family, sensor histidine kinase VicK [Parcubacteria bacterium C7867-001]|nr:MAG: two-component system, OmpR family, sensor histidine kinase VicK [Parcubacteria bacterium C7867-001]